MPEAFQKVSGKIRTPALFIMSWKSAGLSVILQALQKRNMHAAYMSKLIQEEAHKADSKFFQCK